MSLAPVEKSASWCAMSEDAKREFWAALALRHCRGVGVRTVALLLRAFGSALAAVEQPRAWAQAGVGADKTAAFCAGSWRTTAEKEWQEAQRLDCDVLLWTDKRYPRRLREIYAPPPLLYCQGDMSLLNAPALAVVGSRRCSAAGRAQAAFVARQMAASGVTVVSGMATGIDSAAHEAALPLVGRSIGVLGTGIDGEYPVGRRSLFSAMRRRGLLLSEFAPGSPARPENFPVRNRIISGLALAVLVVEAAERSGSLITAREALEQNRDVYVWGGPEIASGPGCLQLAKQGAHMVRSAAEILDDLAPQLRYAALLACQASGGVAPLANAAEPVLNPTAAAPDAALPVGQGASPLAHAAQASATAAHSAQTASSPALPAGAPAQAEAVLHYIWMHPACHADAICAETGVSAASFSVAAIFLEMRGCIRRLPGGHFRCTEE